MTGLLTNVQTFSIHDGPGIRTTVFFKGCNLRCRWCHNPESISPKPEIQFFAHKCKGCKACLSVCDVPLSDGESPSPGYYRKQSDLQRLSAVCYDEAIVLTGYTLSGDQLMEQLERDAQWFARSEGGVTFSGGEPLLQPEFLTDLLIRCRKKGISTAIETALCQPWELVRALADLADLWICDIKSMDTQKHKTATGTGNELILQNIRKLSEKNVRLWLRMPVIPRFNDTPPDMERLADFIAQLPHVEGVQLVPFHNICEGKYHSLGRDYPASGLPAPTDEQLRRLYAPLLAKNLPILP